MSKDSAFDTEKWFQEKTVNRVLELFEESGPASPLSIIALPSAVSAEAEDIPAILTSVGFPKALWLLRHLDDEGVKRVVLLYSGRTPRIVKHGSVELLCFPGEQDDLAEFPVAQAFFPPVFRNQGVNIHSRLRNMIRHEAGKEAAPLPEGVVLQALRWTVGDKALVCFLSAPSNLPPPLLRALLVRGSAQLSSWINRTIELAGPVAAKALDTRVGRSELLFALAVQQKTVGVSVIIPDPTAASLVGLMGGNEWLRDERLPPALFLNRCLVDSSVPKMLEAVDTGNPKSTAYFMTDHIDSFGSHDLKLLVQNWLMPQGITAILDFFFPHGSYDAGIWTRIKSELGPALTLQLATALKEGKNRNSTLSEDAATQLVRAVRTGKLSLSRRGIDIILRVLGAALNVESQKEIDAMTELGVPGVLLERLPADQRMKALANMTERDRLLAFLGQRDYIPIMMEAFSEKGKQRSLEDFDIAAKSLERGEIDIATIVDAKTEACQFIAEHAIGLAMAKVPDSDWKALRTKLAPETVLFLYENPKSCLVESPFRQKLVVGLSVDDIKKMKIARAQEAAASGKVPTIPAMMHRELILHITNEPEPKEDPKKRRR